MAQADPAELAAACLAQAHPAAGDALADGGVLLVGGALGAGADAELAVLALQALGVAAAICAQAAPAFAQAAGAYGLPVLVAPQAASALPHGALVRIDLARGVVEDRGGAARYPAAPLPPAALAAARRAALLGHMRRAVEDEDLGG